MNKEKLVGELRRAHFMIILLSVGVGLLAIINAAGTSLFSNALTYILVALCTLIALTSLAVFISLSFKK